MRARAVDEPHRVATPLELLFDLCFVVAVAQAALPLHHAISEDHVRDGVIRYDPPSRAVALRYAAGITIVQVLWLARLALPESWATCAMSPPRTVAYVSRGADDG